MTLLELLKTQSVTVNQVADIARCDYATAWHHLRMMVRDGVVVRRKTGSGPFIYSLKDDAALNAEASRLIKQVNNEVFLRSWAASGRNMTQ